MIDLPPRLTIEELRTLIASNNCGVYGRRALIKELKTLQNIDDLSKAPSDLELLVAIGGGTKIDQAKAWRAQSNSACQLVAIATRYGSGAEANDIAVLDTIGNKAFYKGSAFRPEARFYVDGTLQSLSDQELLWGCGDSLSHAVEGFLSPLANDSLRIDLAKVINDISRAKNPRDPKWFELSALASGGQSCASVGMVHGIAHTLEAPIVKERKGQRDCGHARLCSAFLLPVLRFNIQASDKAGKILEKYNVNMDRLFDMAASLAKPALDVDLPWGNLISEHWPAILREGSTRTNVALVRSSALESFRTQFNKVC